MKITIVKKAEAKKAGGSVCPWIVEDMPPVRK